MPSFCFSAFLIAPESYAAFRLLCVAAASHESLDCTRGYYMGITSVLVPTVEKLSMSRKNGFEVSDFYSKFE